MATLATRCRLCSLVLLLCFPGKLGITKHNLQKLLVPILARAPPRTLPLEVRAAHERRRRRPRARHDRVVHLPPLGQVGRPQTVHEAPAPRDLEGENFRIRGRVEEVLRGQSAAVPSARGVEGGPHDRPARAATAGDARVPRAPQGEVYVGGRVQVSARRRVSVVFVVSRDPRRRCGRQLRPRAGLYCV